MSIIIWMIIPDYINGWLCRKSTLIRAKWQLRLSRHTHKVLITLLVTSRYTKRWEGRKNRISPHLREFLNVKCSWKCHKIIPILEIWCCRSTAPVPVRRMVNDCGFCTSDLAWNDNPPCNSSRSAKCHLLISKPFCGRESPPAFVTAPGVEAYG